MATTIYSKDNNYDASIINGDFILNKKLKDTNLGIFYAGFLTVFSQKFKFDYNFTHDEIMNDKFIILRQESIMSSFNAEIIKINIANSITFHMHELNFVKFDYEMLSLEMHLPINLCKEIVSVFDLSSFIEQYVYHKNLLIQDFLCGYMGSGCDLILSHNDQ
jgi:hypothetical protein